MTDETKNWGKGLQAMEVKGVIFEKGQHGLTYDQAMAAMNLGKKVKLPEWNGYWFKPDPETGREGIKVFTAQGVILDTPYLLHYQERTDWEITDGSRDFGGALKALKAGKLVRRAGWNGKGMFLFMRPADELSVEFILEKVKSLPESLKSYYKGEFSHTEKEKEEKMSPADVVVPFTAYICMKVSDGSIVNGHVPPIQDILAEDWFVL